MQQTNLKLLIIGGYGYFGGQLVHLLKDQPRLTLLVAGRSQQKANTFCQGIKAEATITPTTFDRDGDLSAQIATLKPNIIIDASGPFQHYGTSPYQVVEAAIARNCHYLDLADASEFVNGIEQFHQAAIDQNIFIISGVSSFPALSSAITHAVSPAFKTIETITGGIDPSPHTAFGPNVIKAAVSHAGRPIAVIKNGQPTTAYGLTEIVNHTIKIPGHIPLRSARFSLIDAPDLLALKKLWPTLQSIWVGVAPRPVLLHRFLNHLAKTISKKWLPPIDRLAPLMSATRMLFKHGQHRGGMFIKVTGQSHQDQPLTKTWNMIAEGDHGPMIPAMAVEAIIHKILAGKTPPPGAHPALHDVSLKDYEKLFSRKNIKTYIQIDPPPYPQTTIYQQILQDTYQTLPVTLQSMHAVKSTLKASGEAKVERSPGLLPNLIAKILSFPPASDNTPIHITMTRQDHQEIWQRQFGNNHFSSKQEVGTGPFDGLLVERFGPLAFGIALVIQDNQLHLMLQRWRAFGIPMPTLLLPSGAFYESQDSQNRFNFHVDIRVPLIGRIVKYNGWLVPNTSQN